MDRAAVLESFDLPNLESGKVEATDHIEGIWRVAISFKGAGARVIEIGTATRLAEELSSCDPGLAAQINVCVEKAQCYAKGGS